MSAECAGSPGEGPVESSVKQTSKPVASYRTRGNLFAGSHLQHSVVSAACVDVAAAGGTLPCGRVPGKPQPLTFIAQAPVALTLGGRRVVRQGVVSAPGLDVRTARGALPRRGIAAKPHPLTLITPPPIGLSIDNTIDGLNTGNIISLQVPMGAAIKRVHECASHIGMGQTQRMSDLMTGDGHKIDTARRSVYRPGFGFIEMEVTGQRSIVGRRVEGVRQDSAHTVKRTSISMIASDKADDHVRITRHLGESQGGHHCPQLEGLAESRPYLRLRQI